MAYTDRLAPEKLSPANGLASCLVCIGPACGPTCRVDIRATTDLAEAIVTDKPKQLTRDDAVEQRNSTSLHLLIAEPIFLGSASASWRPTHDRQEEQENMSLLSIPKAMLGSCFPGIPWKRRMKTIGVTRVKTGDSDLGVERLCRTHPQATQSAG